MSRGEDVQGTVLFLLRLLTKKNLDLTFQYSFDGAIFEILLSLSLSFFLSQSPSEAQLGPELDVSWFSETGPTAISWNQWL